MSAIRSGRIRQQFHGSRAMSIGLETSTLCSLQKARTEREKGFGRLLGLRIRTRRT